jgi:hypothetical protein
MAKKHRQIIGASRLRRKLKRMPDEIQEQVRHAIRRGADEILFHMLNFVPRSTESDPVDYKGRPRKRLYEALEHKISKDGLRARIGILGKKNAEIFFFARFFEFGARPGRKPSGENISAYRSRLGSGAGGYIKQPFISRAFFVTRDKIRRDIRAVTKRALLIVSRSKPPDV